MPMFESPEAATVTHGTTPKRQATVEPSARPDKNICGDTGTPKAFVGQRLERPAPAIAAMDFFVVPTVTFRLVYVWFVIDHDRRRILHVDVTASPAAAWVIQQLREAFPFGTAARPIP